MTTLEVLRGARERVARGWTQEWFAKDASGRDCSSLDPDAKCWCVRGAITAAQGTAEMSPVVVAAEDALREALGHTALAGWNDEPGRTQAEVLGLFDLAIAKLEIRGS